MGLTARVLVVEDDPLLALDVAGMLEAAGFEVLGPAGSVARAFELLEVSICDSAVLDVNLGEETAAPVAARLAARCVPFVTVSGYATSQLPEEFNGATILSKPVDERRLIVELRRRLTARRAPHRGNGQEQQPLRPVGSSRFR